MQEEEYHSLAFFSRMLRLLLILLGGAKLKWVEKEKILEDEDSEHNHFKLVLSSWCRKKRISTKSMY